MNHQEAAQLLPELHRGALDDAARRDVESHLGVCEECAALLRTYRTMHAALEADSGVSETHPSVDEIVRYAVRRRGLNEETAGRITAHVERCDSCAEEVRRTERADLSALGATSAFEEIRSPAVVRTDRATHIVAIAAVILFAALLYPAFLGTFRSSELQERAKTLESEVRDLERSLEDAETALVGVKSWSGAVRLNLLSSAMRDAGAPPRVEVSADEPFVAFGVEIDLPETVGERESLLFRFTDERGSIAAEVRVPGGEARQSIRSAGVVTVLVPSTELSSGRYRLDVLRPDGMDARRILRAEFSVVGVAPG